MVVASATAVISRHHINLAGSGPPRTVQPYHAARGLSLAAASQAIEGAASLARQLARDAIRDAMKAHTIVACGLGMEPSKTLPPLEAILASHPLLHTAEGHLFRTA